MATMDLSKEERLKRLQLEDLGSARREEISTYDDRYVHVDPAELERRRGLNANTDIKRIAQRNQDRLSAWNTAWQNLSGDADVEDLEDLLGGQSHRARLAEEVKRSGGQDYVNDEVLHDGPSRRIPSKFLKGPPPKAPGGRVRNLLPHDEPATLFTDPARVDPKSDPTHISNRKKQDKALSPSTVRVSRKGPPAPANAPRAPRNSSSSRFSVSSTDPALNPPKDHTIKGRASSTAPPRPPRKDPPAKTSFQIVENPQDFMAAFRGNPAIAPAQPSSKPATRPNSSKSSALSNSAAPRPTTQQYPAKSANYDDTETFMSVFKSQFMSVAKGSSKGGLSTSKYANPPAPSAPGSTPATSKEGAAAKPSPAPEHSIEKAPREEAAAAPAATTGTVTSEVVSSPVASKESVTPVPTAANDTNVNDTNRKSSTMSLIDLDADEGDVSFQPLPTSNVGTPTTVGPSPITDTAPVDRKTSSSNMEDLAGLGFGGPTQEPAQEPVQDSTAPPLSPAASVVNHKVARDDYEEEVPVVLAKLQAELRTVSELITECEKDSFLRYLQMRKFEIEKDIADLAYYVSGNPDSPVSTEPGHENAAPPNLTPASDPNTAKTATLPSNADTGSISSAALTPAPPVSTYQPPTESITPAPTTETTTAPPPPAPLDRSNVAANSFKTEPAASPALSSNKRKTKRNLAGSKWATDSPGSSRPTTATTTQNNDIATRSASNSISSIASPMIAPTTPATIPNPTIPPATSELPRAPVSYTLGKPATPSGDAASRNPSVSERKPTRKTLSSSKWSS